MTDTLNLPKIVWLPLNQDINVTVLKIILKMIMDYVHGGFLEKKNCICEYSFIYA